MTLIFWQNIISPHQLPFIRKCTSDDSSTVVILISEKDTSKKREDMGWNPQKIEERSNFKVIVTPSNKEIETVFHNHPNAQHFFSGLRSNPMIFSAFKESLKHAVKRHLIVEGPYFYKYPQTAHYIRTLIKDLKYYKHINKVFAIGSHALDWYTKFSFKKNQVIPFSYAVECTEITKHKIISGPVKFIFVGGLTHRKGVDLLLTSLRFLDEDYVLDIIGDGDQRQSLEKYCAKNNLSKVKFLGTKDNNEIRKIYNDYDIHILPSRHDGWGAVINEALMSGLFILCSKNCGAQELIKDKFNGLVFSHNKKNDLYNSLSYCIENIEEIRLKKNDIKKWSRCIEGEVIAEYFIESLNSNKLRTPPWRNFDQNRFFQPKKENII